MAEVNKVYNHDIVGLYNRLNRFVEELYKSVSSATSEVNLFDQTRLETYLNAIDTYHNWVNNQPHLDLPETHPREYILEEKPKVEETENENVNDVIRLLVLCRDELINSQSARNPAQLNEFDSMRLRAVTAKTRAFLVEYVQVSTPLDMPESSPQEVLSGPGRMGV